MMMLLLLGGLGLASLPLWPPPWRLGLALGWGLALLLELLLLQRGRTALQRADRSLLAVQVFGFLAKLAILAAGGILGATSGLYHAASFLLAFAAGAFLLHLLVLRASLRAARRGTTVVRGPSRPLP